MKYLNAHPRLQINEFGLLNPGQDSGPTLAPFDTVKEHFKQIIDSRALGSTLRPIPGTVHISYLTFFTGDGQIDFDAVNIQQIFRDKKVYIDQPLAIIGETGFDAAVLALVCFLFTGCGITGI